MAENDTPDDLDQQIDELAVEIEETIAETEETLNQLPDFSPRSKRSRTAQEVLNGK